MAEWILPSGLEQYWIVDPDLDHPKVTHLKGCQSRNQKQSSENQTDRIRSRTLIAYDSVLAYEKQIVNSEEEAEERNNHNVQF